MPGVHEQAIMSPAFATTWNVIKYALLPLFFTVPVAIPPPAKFAPFLVHAIVGVKDIPCLSDVYAPNTQKAKMYTPYAGAVNE